MFKKENLSIIIPIISALIALLTFLLGPNIIGKIYSDPHIVIDSKKINNYYPKSLRQIIGDYYSKNNETTANTLRIINIKNEGSSSKNIRILLKLDGSISDYESNSTEVISDEKIDLYSNIVLTLTRLSNNASIELKVWLKEENRPFEVSYTDDVSSKIISEKNQNLIIYYTIFYSFLVIVFIASVLFILNNIIRKTKAKRKEEEQNQMFERVLIELNDSIQEDFDQEDSTKNVKNTTNEKDKFKERLRELVKKSS
ncbi:hypothetical protein [Paenibacillus alba]|uniref:Uncharacterized protein n=1 Tax=Paenibacillus alba TaxID=1197127 RepID=A0ABU6G3K5_9BACL|nr:hypothetical protein [Paenibacillus alba]MEC0228743.1 hypothetical protein [Paenibacillus alba]